jgi:hypothetical protein
MLATGRIVLLAALGLCEHCGELLTIQDLPAEAIDADWKCPKCHGVITHVTFGYDQGGRGAKIIRWVGKDGKWTDVKPEEDFRLGDWFITVETPSPCSFDY